MELATVTFSDRMVLYDGTQRVELIRLGPAHSRGDSVAYLPKQKIVVTGDLCVTWQAGNNMGDADVNYDGWVKALATMESWDVATVVPGMATQARRLLFRDSGNTCPICWPRFAPANRQVKSAEQLTTEINLTRHGSLAASASGNAAAIRAMYKHL